MKKLLKKTLKLILPVVLGGFILFWVYRDFDFTKAGDVLLHGTNWWWMLFSLLFGVFAQVFRGWRWRQTLEPLDAFPKKSDCVNAIFISYAASLVVPRIGEVSRCGVLAKYDNVSFAKSLGTVVTERLVDTLTILLITGITVLLQLPIFVTFLQQTGTKIPSLVHLLTSVWFYIILFCFIGVVILLYYLRKTLFFYERVKGFVLNIWEGIMSLKGVRNIPIFNGGEEKVFDGEERILIPSPDVPTFDLKPEMSAYEVTDAVVKVIEEEKYDVIILNYANCDMVGHTGIFDAAKQAVEAVDTCVGRMVDAILAKGGVALITADHGNADKMCEPDGTPFTAHTTNPVPFIVVGEDCKLRDGGVLADIAPTMLQVLGLPQPEEMTGKSLIVSE